VHTKSFASALRGALREDPTIILVAKCAIWKQSNLPDRGEHGSLGLRTLHTQSAAKTVDRILTFFPQTTKQDSANAFRIAQRRGGANVIQAHRQERPLRGIEILVFTPPWQTSCAKARRTDSGHDPSGKKLGNQPLDDHIMEHLRMKRIAPEDAYEKALAGKNSARFSPSS